ncbi:alpha/beta hydrolase family protein [Streptomyces johnsoniae]|uniref:Alpha/beta hydrolase n=1 Tax=Streptomyces johnsoniae TaxID=3075532 RepID=A0ABU2S3K8_9ACTN|nr:alpha/beta hydrolase [Streptomyces sp. DSM 41886]MDT0442185.1 alpha/beta hydrolase [Streptomyces sp. DSM 41886]
MSPTRRTLLTLGAGSALAIGASALTGNALATPTAPYRPARVRPAADAPAEPFAVGLREFNWSRGGRTLVTRVWYPAQGSPGGDPIRDAPVADGPFPVVEWSHGLYGTPEVYLSEILPLAEAGFVVPAPVFPTTAEGTEGNIQDVYNGNQSRDVSEVITRTLALNDASGDPFAGRLDVAAGVGVAGHSLGGMTTHGLLTAWPDSRIRAAVPFACVDMGDPTGEVAANTLFIHGDQDPVCQYSLARQAYSELAAPKAFLTHVGQGHDEYVWGNGVTYPQTRATFVDWMRWSLYADTAARDRLADDAASDGTAWEAELG